MERPIQNCYWVEPGKLLAGEYPREPDHAPALTTAALDAIDRHIAEGRTVYVHCFGGVGRTGVIVGCWLVRHGRTGDEALERLAELWRDCPKSSRHPRSPQMPEQVDYVRNWREST